MTTCYFCHYPFPINCSLIGALTCKNCSTNDYTIKNAYQHPEFKKRTVSYIITNQLVIHFEFYNKKHLISILVRKNLTNLFTLPISTYTNIPDLLNKINTLTKFI